MKQDNGKISDAANWVVLHEKDGAFLMTAKFDFSNRDERSQELNKVVADFLESLVKLGVHRTIL